MDVSIKHKETLNILHTRTSADTQDGIRGKLACMANILSFLHYFHFGTFCDLGTGGDSWWLVNVQLTIGGVDHLRKKREGETRRLH